MALESVAIEVFAQLGELTLWDVAFIIFVIGLLLTMTGAFGDPNLVFVGLVVSIVGLIAMVLGPYSTPLVLGGMIPIVAFIVFYIYRYFEFPREERPEQTSSAASLVGAGGRVTEVVTERSGEIKLDGGGFDPYYRCQTDDGPIEEGERAVVVDPGGGNVLTVAPEGAVDIEPQTPEETPGWKVVDDVKDAVDRLRERLAN